MATRTVNVCPKTRPNRPAKTTSVINYEINTDKPPLPGGSEQWYLSASKHLNTNDSVYFSGVVGMDENVEWGRCASAKKDREVISILSLAEMAGMSTGLVTTTRITHASPTSAYAHSVDRRWESDADKKAKASDDASSCRDIGKIKHLSCSS